MLLNDMKKNNTLKKIRKFIFHPVQFVRESFWFAVPYFSNKVKPNQGSLFVVSTLGQLHQMEALISRNNITGGMLVILYTQKNMSMPKLIYDVANKSVFRCIYQFELPTGLGDFNLKKFNFIKRGYSSLLKEVQAKELYMASFAGHYSLLLKLATNRGLETHLVEEGSGTYTPLVDCYNPGKIESKKLKGYLSTEGYFYKFDHIHVAFPELLKSVFKAESYNRFFAHLGGKTLDKNIFSLQEKYNVSSDDYIYVSQLFPALNDKIYYSCVVDILEDILKTIKGKIYIKLHPKEMGKKHVMSYFLQYAKKNNRLVVINEPAFLIEPFIYYTRPKGILGITSSTLIYAPLMSSQTSSISLSNILVNLLKDREQNTNLIEKHLKIIQIYQHVVLLDAQQCCDHIHNMYQPSMELSELLIQAHNCYINQHLEEAIFYWEIACAENIEILGSKSLWYYNALHKTQQYFKMNSNCIAYIDSLKEFSVKDQKTWDVIKSSYNEFILFSGSTTNEKITETLTRKELLAKAHASYHKKKNMQAINYWKRAIGDDITILGKKSLWFYNALHREKRYYLMKDNEIDFINSITDFSFKDQEILKKIKTEYLKAKGEGFEP